ncbi:arginine--tRNA ligase [Defluviitalea raffinosedens]|uniref:arginine--tRNA ligase n=1 Tax=Defluviitalea raffinosedens TaxID=1450156 RepID=UPI00195C270F|nr:arginine--tRNA ligase [Defluviitalea raffinosedens]MBM7686047.1 arginyl-tRNA synthetase [Defluviitalea raffinosedens]
MDFKVQIADLLYKQFNDLSKEEIISMLEIPPSPDMGDYAFPCFRLAKLFKKSPAMIAEETVKVLEKPDFIKEIKNVTGYINFYIDKAKFASAILESVLKSKEKYGSSNEGEGKNIVVDYSAPNIAKPFHVGHLRSTVIGGSIYRIYKHLGYNCIGVNHLGDWGTQFGKLIVAYKKWGSKEAVEQGGIKELMRIYVLFHEEAEKDPSLEDEARSWFTKMERGDEEALSLWNWFKDISLEEFNKVYKLLGVEFDSYAGESFYNDKMEAIIEELDRKGLLKDSEGAKIVDLEDVNMPPCLITKKDGSTLYATRDITAAIYRKNTYDFHKCIYVTALAQNLHFAQWFEVIKRMGYDWYDRLVHVPFGLVSMETGKLSTRKGNVVLLEELLKEAIEKTKQIINDKNPDLEDKETVAEQVGIGAVVFNDLSNNRIKDVVFSWDKVLNFDGETGPYVQYTHARACSVLRKSDIKVDEENIDFNVLTDPASIEVIRLIGQFPEKVKDAAEKLEPSFIARYVVDLAQAFNKFYHDNPILTEDEAVKKARLALVYSVKIVLSSGLYLLGVKSPEKM